MPASTTKIMTAILALEKCNLTDEVTISENPPKADGSSIGIEQSVSPREGIFLPYP